MYNKTKTNIQEVLIEFNKIHQNLQSTLEQENNNIKFFRRFYFEKGRKIGI
jgi:hypothetical protein